MKVFRFLDFQMYKESKAFYKEIVALTKAFPRQYWELGDQVRRSSLSVCLNIAEGCAKRSDKDFNRYLETALGSINETVAGIDIGLNESLISSEKFNSLYSQAENITRQIGGFSRKLSTKI